MASSQEAPGSMRVDVAKLDKLINMAGELALAGAILRIAGIGLAAPP
jgi:chemotaxis protein histidine kinase CheA